MEPIPPNGAQVFSPSFLQAAVSETHANPKGKTHTHRLIRVGLKMGVDSKSVGESLLSAFHGNLLLFIWGIYMHPILCSFLDFSSGHVFSGTFCRRGFACSQYITVLRLAKYGSLVLEHLIEIWSACGL